MLDVSGFASGAQQLNGYVNDLGFRTQAASGNLGILGTVMGTLANPMTAVALAASAAGAALAGSVQAASAWETVMAGVAKTTGLSGQPLAELSKELQDLSTNMPVAASSLAGIAQVAGSLGVATGDIAKFTETAAMMSVAFEMPAEEAATMSAKILNSFQQPISSMQNLGNVVNALGDSFAATEPQILEFLNRASFLNTTFKQTIPQVASLGTVLISAGLDADVAATGIKSLLNIGLSETSKKGGITTWASLMGTTVADLKEQIGSDLNGTLVETAEKIASIEDPVARFNAAVAIAGTEGAPALLKLAGQADNLKVAFEKASGEWENGSSMLKTFEANSATLDSQWQIFTNTLMKAGVELGNVLLPSIVQGVKDLTDFTKAAISAGEAMYGMATAGMKQGDKAIKDFGSWYGDMFGINPQANEISAAEMGAQVASVYSQYVADGIVANSGEIGEGIKGAMGGDAAKKAASDAGKLTGTEFTKAFGSQFEAGMSYGADYISKSTGELVKGSGKWFGGDTSTNKNMQRIGIASINGVDITSIYNASLKQFELRDGSGNTLISASASSLGIVDPGSPDGRAEAIRKLLEMSSWGKAVGQIESLKLEGLGGEATKATLESSIEIENLWDISDTQRNWDKWRDANKDAIEKTSDEIDLALYNAMNKIAETGDKTLGESLDNIMKALADPGSVDTAVLDQSLADLMGEGLLNASQSAEVKAAATKSSSNILSLFGTAMNDLKGKVDLTKILSDPAEFQKAVMDIPAFMENTFQPAFREQIDFFHDQWDSGLGEAQLQTANFVNSMIDKAADMPELFTSEQLTSIYMYQNGLIGIGELLDQLSAKTESASKATTNYAETVSAYEQAMFYGSYIGPTSEYDEWLAKDRETRASISSITFKVDTAELDSAGTKLTDIQMTAESGISAKVDITQADEALTGMKGSIDTMKESVSPMPITADTTRARAEIANFTAYVEALHPVINVGINIEVYASQVQAIVENAILSALASVRTY